jgi:AcrR family transcriptional regulator
MASGVTGQRAGRTRLSPEARRAQVLAAARRVFLTSGSEGATIKAIARSAEVTETAIYHHFPSKDELFRQAVEEPLHALVSAVRSRMHELAQRPDMSRRQLLATANETFLAAMVEIAPLLAVTLFSEGEQSREFYTTQIWPQLTEAVDALITAGWPVQRADPELATLGFLGVHYGVVMDSVLAEEKLDVAEAAAHITALFEGSIESRRAAGARPATAARRRERMAGPDRRNLIIAAAREAFLETGLSGTRMKDIARRAGLTDAGLYAHFDSKDELYRAAVQLPLERLVARFTAEIRTLADDPAADRAELLRRANEQLLGCMVELTPLLALALFSELEPGRRFYREVFLPRLEEATLSIVRGVYGAAAPAQDELDVLVEAILGVHFGVALDNLMRGREVDVPKVAARLSELIVLPEPPDPVRAGR